MNFLDIILGVLAVLSSALFLWQFVAARKFPLHKDIAIPGFSPAVSILKPLKGCDATTAESLASWFKQDYSGKIEILFGAADANDPVCALVKDLIARHSEITARLVICEDASGMNAKAAKLAELEKLAQHKLILISDADVRVPSDFLASFVAPLRDEKMGLVNCFYRLANPTTAAMRWECVAINADFWSQVLQAQTMKPLRFALGAAILMRREALEQIGGFQSLTDCLADDYQLGNRIAKNGHGIAVCPIVVECWDAPMDWTSVWKHQLRWARTIRTCQPLPYFLSILANAAFWPMLWLLASLTITGSMRASLMAMGLLALRIVLAQDLQRRFTPDKKLISPAHLVLAKDVLQVALWISAFAGNKVEWRGRKMKLRRDGTLVAVNATVGAIAKPAVPAALRADVYDLS